MAQTIILGKASQGKSAGSLSITTPHGDVLIVDAADIEGEEQAEAGGDLKRYKLKEEAKVYVEFSGKSLAGIDAATSTITKWLDDGGTISKSRDDG